MNFYDLDLRIYSRDRGFTLIELLIVIAIIGVLSALLMANFIGIRQRARDSQRKADLRQIQSALELYRSDNSSYPVTASFPVCGQALVMGTTTYMKKIPCDPTGGGWNGGSFGESYAYSSNGTTYTLRTCLENGSDKEQDNPKRFCNNLNQPASFTLNDP